MHCSNICTNLEGRGGSGARNSYLGEYQVVLALFGQKEKKLTWSKQNHEASQSLQKAEGVGGCRKV